MRGKPPISPAAARLVCVLFGLGLLGVIELGLRRVVPPTRLDSILAVLRPDPDLFWTQKKGLRAEFFGTPVSTDRLGLRSADAGIYGKKADFRILTLGASPTFGWGVSADKTYSAELGRLLGKDFGDRVEVVNGGCIGYSTYQGLAFLRKYVSELRPDLIIAAYVINDVDKYRFFRNNGLADKNLKPGCGPCAAAADLLSRTALFRTLRKGLKRLGGFLNRGGPGEIDHAVFPGEVRVSPEDYESNIKGIVGLARSSGVEVVLVKMPVNLPKGGPSVFRAEALKSYRAGRALAEAGDCSSAAALLERAVSLDPNLSEPYYFLGTCARTLGRPGEAARCFQLVKERESFRCARDAAVYNAIMGRVALSERVPLFDAAAEFEKYSRRYLFLDPKADTIHPNPEGHAIIGAGLAELIAPIVRGRLSGG